MIVFRLNALDFRLLMKEKGRGRDFNFSWLLLTFKPWQSD